MAYIRRQVRYLGARVAFLAHCFRVDGQFVEVDVCFVFVCKGTWGLAYDDRLQDSSDELCGGAFGDVDVGTIRIQYSPLTIVNFKLTFIISLL